MSVTPVLLLGRLRLGCGLLALVLTLGTVGFMVIEGWTLIQALYTSVLVVSTLGFSDLRPSDARGQLLTIGLIAGGVGTLYYLVGTFAQTVIEDQLDWGRRRTMDQQIAKLKNHFIICGFGRVGQELARQLSLEQCLFVVIDNREDRVEQIRSLGYYMILGDASDDEVLLRAGVARARALLTAVQSDAANVYVTLSARALNSKLFIVARASTSEAEHKLRIAGANRVISPYILGGRSMAAMALRPTVMDLMNVLVHSDDLEMWLEQIGVEDGSNLAGVTVGDARLRERAGLTILAVRRADGKMIVNPAPSITLHTGDTLIVLGSRQGIDQADQDSVRY